MVQRLDAREPSFPQAFASLLSAKREVAEDVDQAVRAIIEDVVARGDEALIDFTYRFDGLALQPETLRISQAEIDAAEAQCPKEALEALTKEWASRRKVQIDFEVVGSPRPLPLRIEIGLYRILQEALTNIGRHAYAHVVSVQLQMMLDQVRLLIGDDGRGFDPEQVRESSFGLVGMNERAKLLGGTLEVCSSEGEGTQLEVIVPVELL